MAELVQKWAKPEWSRLGTFLMNLEQITVLTPLCLGHDTRHTQAPFQPSQAWLLIGGCSFILTAGVGRMLLCGLPNPRLRSGKDPKLGSECLFPEKRRKMMSQPTTVQN